MANPPKAAGIYCRLSYAPDGSLEKVERQEADCRDLTDRLGWTVSEDHVFSDNNRSAWQRNRKRPQWERMLEAIEAREIDGIVVYHGDRLIRQPYDLEKLLNIADSKGVRLASPSGTRDLDNPDDRFVLRIEAAQACRSSDDTSRRVKRGLKTRALQGKRVAGGKRGFGFEIDAETPIPSECAVIAEAISRLLAGQMEGGVIKWMNSVSTTTTGGQWERRSFEQVILAPRVVGLVYFDGEYYKAAWPPIVPVEDQEAVRLLFKQRAEEYPYPGGERKYLLSTWAKCPSGHSLRVKPSGGRNRKSAKLYYCKKAGCKTQVGRNLELLDAYVEGRVLALLNNEEFLAEVMASDPSVAAEIVDLEKRKAKTREQLENIADHPDLDAGLLATALASFDKKITRLKNRAAASQRRRLLVRMAGISRQEWDELPVDVRTSVVKATYRVTVLPTKQRGPGFDPSAVRLERMPLAEPEESEESPAAP